MAYGLKASSCDPLTLVLQRVFPNIGLFSKGGLLQPPQDYQHGSEGHITLNTTSYCIDMDIFFPLTQQ